MTTALQESPPDVASGTSSVLSNFEDRFPEACKLSATQAGWVLAACCIYLWYSVQPLWHTDLWGHLSYGRWMWEHGRLPDPEPLMPLAHGMPFVNTSWLAQLLGYAGYRWAGLAGLQGGGAVLITISALLLARLTWLKTRHSAAALCAWIVFLALDWHVLRMVRPQLCGLTIFLLVLLLTLGGRSRPYTGWCLAGWHAVWANIHGSFVIGLGLLAALWLGRGYDVLRRTRHIQAVFRDRIFWRYAWWFELSATAGLLNPWGWGLYREVLAFPSHPNVQALSEWQPMMIREPHGWLFALSVLLLVVVYRLTPRRIQTWEVLCLAGLAVGSLWSVRLIAFYAPVAAYLLSRHAFHTIRNRWPNSSLQPPAIRAGKWSIVALGLVWIAFGFSPLGIWTLHGKQPLLRQAVSAWTPWQAVDYLREKQVRGLVWNSYEWGDYLLWAAPQDIQVFVASHVPQIPPEVWQHYLQVAESGPEWHIVLDRYGINTVILDKAHRNTLLRRLREDPQWQLGYEDRLAAVFIRKRSI
ncbi:MAG: hypothetical protein KatS3mg113_1018 [Planctomycetaceae bacterium]|nr:MAG: hypothetical protein KatS3mg113_1018 [Planctomycetaceae bacterium]